jgi:hypothetical protein
MVNLTTNYAPPLKKSAAAGRILIGKNEIELDINAESIRLIAITVIFYNATLLSTLYQHYHSVDPEKTKEID